MESPWSIIYYETASGKSPIYDFVESLETLEKARIINAINLLEEYGILLSTPHVKKIQGEKLWELRVLGSTSIRLFYIIAAERQIILLHAFKKKSQKTPKQEIAIATKRAQLYR